MGSSAYFCVLILLLQFLHFSSTRDYPFSSDFSNESELFENIDSDFIRNSAISENCSEALEAFIIKSTNFTRCAALNASPVRLCRSCYKELNSTHAAYKKLKLIPDPCNSTFFQSHQICIIDVIYNQVNAVWSKSGNCDSCYGKLQGVTDKFFDTGDELDACLQKSNFSGKSTNDTCEMCNELYKNVTIIYKEYLKLCDKKDLGLCEDIVDKMNITRQFWQSQCGRIFDYNIGYANVLTAVLVGTMPVFFYLLAKNISIIEDVKIVRPKRKNYISIPSS
ncbi:osteopetrosis-associated transmembrane protein 1-like [Uloborus diversus]|uniref:osteopetrosis-associated transmembrane protein 1-like n=1 Tax=Uloborus diversus TaxID=327109 RepID=UPI0024096701|nr:osteopetrosis-associated transmembrane protein 1-like [Uloborus diversus]